MNDVDKMFYACSKAADSKLGIKPKKKAKSDKNKKNKVES